jgi:ABC-type dipeptide/oligopeptide/nickel transport system ATPase component
VDTILRVKDLQVNIPLASGDLRAVRGIDFEVGAGQTLGIVGESGCGKSLSSLAVMGLLPRIARVHAQQIEFEGTDLRNLSEKKMSDIREVRVKLPVNALCTCCKESVSPPRGGVWVIIPINCPAGKGNA